MEGAYFFFIFITFLVAHSDAAGCENGWMAYKEELCLKSFPISLTYDEAKVFCSFQGNELSKPKLVMVKQPEMQNLLASYKHGLRDNVWLGSKYDIPTAHYKWEDGENLTYTNWQDGYSNNMTISETCIEMVHDGKWVAANCEKRNMVICQKQLSWTLEDAMLEIIRNRKEFEDELKRTKDEVKQQIETISTMVVPVGSIYIQYFDQPSPVDLWPLFSWSDISNTYAGLFFRVEGGFAASWGRNQTGCAPHISRMNYMFRWDTAYPSTIEIPWSGWSEYGGAGAVRNYNDRTGFEGIRLFTEECEVRPTNQAMRLWKRTA